MVASYPLLSLTPTPVEVEVEVELGCDNSSSTDPDGIYDHAWIQTDVTDNPAVVVDFASQSLQDEKQCSISSNLARWRLSEMLVSWIC